LGFWLEALDREAPQSTATTLAIPLIAPHVPGS